MKRVISFVLVLALVLGSFSMAFAAPLTDVDGSDNEVAITVVNDLGIIEGYPDGSFQGEKLVTRAEFAAMIVRALAIPESALAGYTTTTFKDTEGYGWAVKYLAFCEDKGIMLGDGQGNAMPGRTINTNEAVTMMLRAMGLTDNAAILVGNWPSNYVTEAKNIGLYDDVASQVNVTREMAAQIIYNALTEAGYAIDAEGNDSGAPALINGLVDTSLTDYNAIVYYTPDTLIPLAEYIGAFGTIYYNDDQEIVAIDVESTFLTGTLDASEDTFTVDDVDYTLSGSAPTTSIPAINNGLRNGLATLADGDYTFSVDVVGKTIRDIYAIVDWTVTDNAKVDDTVQDEINDDQELLGEKFVLDNDNEIKEASFELLGAASLDKIAEDDVVYVYSNTFGIVRIEVGTETVEGKVTKVWNDDGTQTYVIGGKDYTIATESAISPLSVGDEGTATLNYAGEIYDWEEDSSLVGNYAVFVADDLKTNFNEATIKAKLLTKDGTEITPVVDTDATTLTGITAGDIVDYALNSDGELDEITKAAVQTTVTAKDIEADLIGNYKVAKSVVIFLEDSGDYSVGKFEDLASDVTALKIVLDDNEIVAILADSTNQGTTDSSYGIITGHGADGLNEDGDKVKLADIILEAEVKEDVITKATGTVSTDSTTTAALYEITIDEDGVITEVTSAAAKAITTATAVTVEAIDGNLITIGDGSKQSFKVADDVIVYIYDADDGWTVGKLSQVKKLTITLFETDDDVTGAEYIVAW